MEPQWVISVIAIIIVAVIAWRVWGEPLEELAADLAAVPDELGHDVVGLLPTAAIGRRP